jgi:hypothetical protein
MSSPDSPSKSYTYPRIQSNQYIRHILLLVQILPQSPILCIHQQSKLTKHRSQLEY